MQIFTRAPDGAAGFYHFLILIFLYIFKQKLYSLIRNIINVLNPYYRNKSSNAEPEKILFLRSIINNINFVRGDTGPLH